jgi:RHS repeat-associated protein
LNAALTSRHDSETDLFENWNRYYDPSIGRYLSPEPLLQDPKFVGLMAKRGQSMPTYSYANNNPVSKYDPNGRTTAELGIGVGLAAVAVTIAVQLRMNYCAAHPGECTLPAIPNGRWEPVPGEPGTDRWIFPERPLIPPVFPPCPPKKPDPDRESCIQLYTLCSQGPCGLCLLKCVGAREWDFAMCPM